MKKLIEDWERSANKYYELGIKADHGSVRREGLLCRSEVYNYCASKLKEILLKKDDEYKPKNGR